MHASTNAVLKLAGDVTADGTVAPHVLEGTIANVCGIMSLQEGVFGGIIVGIGVAVLHNRYHTIHYRMPFPFRRVPLCSYHFHRRLYVCRYCHVLHLATDPKWHLCSRQPGYRYRLYRHVDFRYHQEGSYSFGLHHVFYLPFWQTGVGGSMMIDGNLVQGGQNIFFAQLASANVTHFSADATRYFSGEFIFMIFGLPGAALAMYRCAKPERKGRWRSSLVGSLNQHVYRYYRTY